MAATPDEERFKVTTRILVVFASIFAFLAIFTSWIDRQALDTDEWTSTSGRLLNDKAISDTVAEYAVDSLFANVNVSDEIKTRLPDRAKPLAAPAAGAIRQFATTVAKDAIRDRRIQAAWKQANRTAHSSFVAILEDRSSVVETGNGEVILDLRPLVEQLAARVGVSKGLANKIPPDVARLEIVRADELKTAQKVTKLLKGLNLVFSIGSLLLFALAAYLARGRRWAIVLGYGLGLIASGALALVLRKVIGGIVVDQLVTDETATTAAEHAFGIGTDLLASIAKTVIAWGAFFVLAAFLDSPASSAVRARRVMAPSFIERQILVWSAFGVLVVVLLAAAPPHSASGLWVQLVLILLGAFGLEALNRKIHHEFPDAKRGEFRERVQERVRELGAEGAKRTRAAIGELSDNVNVGRQPDPADLRLERLKKLGELRDSGILTDEEFTSEKQRLLSGEAAPPPS